MSSETEEQQLLQGDDDDDGHEEEVTQEEQEELLRDQMEQDEEDQEGQKQDQEEEEEDGDLLEIGFVNEFDGEEEEKEEENTRTDPVPASIQQPSLPFQSPLFRMPRRPPPGTRRQCPSSRAPQSHHLPIPVQPRHNDHSNVGPIRFRSDHTRQGNGSPSLIGQGRIQIAEPSQTIEVDPEGRTKGDLGSFAPLEDYQDDDDDDQDDDVEVVEEDGDEVEVKTEEEAKEEAFPYHEVAEDEVQFLEERPFKEEEEEEEEEEMNEPFVVAENLPPSDIEVIELLDDDDDDDDDDDVLIEEDEEVSVRPNMPLFKRFDIATQNRLKEISASKPKIPTEMFK